MKNLPLFLILLTFIACQPEKKPTASAGLAKPTALSYKYDSVKVYSKHPVSEAENIKDTSKAVISYPVFEVEKINQFIAQKVLSSANPDEQYANYQDFATAFIKNFDDYTNENKDYIQTWFMDGKVEVTEQKPQYLSMLYTYVNYAGGAHINSSFNYLNYDPENQVEIALDSLIKPGSMPALTAVAEKIFRKNENLSPSASLKDIYFFDNDKFSLNQNFSITNNGLKFLYNPYEIKAFAFGTTELVIPFADLKDIARPNSLLNPLN